MKLTTLRTLLAATVSVTLASAAFATTWNAAADFSTTSATGVWSYGSCAVINNNWASTDLDVANYVFTADAYSDPTFRTEAPGFVWYARPTNTNPATGNPYGTEWGDAPQLAWTGVYTGASVYWVFPEPGLYVQPYAIGAYDGAGSGGSNGLATVLRWTAPESGTFDLAGSVTDRNVSGLMDQLIKTDVNGVRSVLHIAASPLAVDAADSLDGSVTLAAGETLDVITYQSPVYKRTFGQVDFTITSAAVPEPTSLGLLGLGSLALLRRRRA